MKKQQNEELKRLENDLKANGKLDEAAKRIAAEGKAQSDGEIMVTAAKELGMISPSLRWSRPGRKRSLWISRRWQRPPAGKNIIITVSPRTNYVCTANYGSETEDEYGHDAMCLTVWHCATIALHTESKDKQVNCWKDYLCYLVNLRQSMMLHRRIRKERGKQL